MVATIFNVSAFFVVLREVLEACLVVGIVLAYLNRTGATHLRKWVWLGAATGVTISLLLGISFAVVFYVKRRQLFSGARSEHIFEGITFMIAAVLLTWMLLWMMRLKKRIKGHMERTMATIVSREDQKSSKLGIFSMVFIQVFREGIEAFVFLLGASGTSQNADEWRGIPLPGMLAVVIGVSCSYAVFRGMVLLDIGVFFMVSTIVLILFSAGLVSHSIHELQEAALFGAWTETNDATRDWWNAAMWDTSMCCHDRNNEFFAFLRALFGYQDTPTFLEWISYFAYWLIIVTVVVIANWSVVRAAATFVANLTKFLAAYAVLCTFVSFVYSCRNPSWISVLVSTLAFVLSVCATLAAFDCFSGPDRKLAPARRLLALLTGVATAVLTLFAAALHIAQMACDERRTCYLPKFYYFGLIFNRSWTTRGRALDGSSWVSLGVLSWSLLFTVALGGMLALCLVVFAGNVLGEDGTYMYDAEVLKLGDEYREKDDDSLESAIPVQAHSLDSGRGNVHPMLS